MFPDQEEPAIPALFARQPFTLDEVSPEIHEVSRKNYSALLRNMNQLGLATIGDKLQLHSSNVCRMKDSGELLKVAATNAGIGIDILAMEEEIKELRRQNEAFQILLAAKLISQKEKPEISSN